MPADKFEQRKAIALELFEARRSDLPHLRAFDMQLVAHIRFKGNQIAIDLVDDWKDPAPGVYAFVAARRVVRVGSSSKGVPVRLRQYPRHINNALTNATTKTPELKTPTPVWEAKLWAYIYRSLADGKGEVWARPSKSVECALGRAPARITCKVEESIVAERFVAPGLRQPLLNRSSRIT